MVGEISTRSRSGPRWPLMNPPLPHLIEAKAKHCSRSGASRRPKAEKRHILYRLRSRRANFTFHRRVDCSSGGLALFPWTRWNFNGLKTHGIVSGTSWGNIGSMDNGGFMPRQVVCGENRFTAKVQSQLPTVLINRQDVPDRVSVLHICRLCSSR